MIGHKVESAATRQSKVTTFFKITESVVTDESLPNAIEPCRTMQRVSFKIAKLHGLAEQECDHSLLSNSLRSYNQIAISWGCSLK